MQLKGLKLVHLHGNLKKALPFIRVFLVIFVISFFNFIVTSTSNHGYMCHLTEVVHVLFFY